MQENQNELQKDVQTKPEATVKKDSSQKESKTELTQGTTQASSTPIWANTPVVGGAIAGAFVLCVILCIVAVKLIKGSSK